ncbi:MAG TPA: LuxR C-terminal-related transcriptional regulator [Roseiflexaceae bacterium]|nr:LuxR C-terminal-related transcriptional regulator [Roseiflexaceae bacterium]
MTTQIRGFQAIIQIDPSTPEGVLLVGQLAAGKPVPIEVRLNLNSAPGAGDPVNSPQDPWDERVTQCLERFGLTLREAQIVILDALGWERRKIAEHFNISVRTVDWYWTQINTKLQVSDRSAVRVMVKGIAATLPV